MSGLDELLNGPPKHLERFAPPWVRTRRTICGRTLDDVQDWIEFTEARDLIRTVGETRARLLFCQTCLNMNSKVNAPTAWEKLPADVTVDWAARGRWAQNPETEEIRALLLALGRLVDAHRDEFEAMVNAYLTDEITSRRKKRNQA